MDRLLTNRTSTWFLWVFGKEQLSVTASRGVSLMPQLKTAKPAGPQSTVPYFTCFKVALIVWPIFTCLLLKGPSFGAISLNGLNLPHSVLFPPMVTQHNEPRSKLSKSHWNNLCVPFNETLQPVCCPCVTEATIPCCTSHWSAMDLLRWAHLFPHEDDVTIETVLGVWEGPALPVLYQQLAQWNTNILLRT